MKEQEATMADVYRKLMRHLGNVGIGYPHYDEFLEVLEKKITPEEAEIALGLPTRLPPFEVEEVEEIAKRANKPVAEVARNLESLAQKGFLYNERINNGYNEETVSASDYRA